MRASRIAIALTLPAVVLCVAQPAEAAWTGNGGGSAAARAMVMPAGLKPTASVSGSDVTLRWPAALLPGPTPVAAYRISRYDSNGTAALVLASCAGTINSTTCTEHNVPAGTWSYTDTPVQDSWTGVASPPSNPVSVGPA